MAAEEYILKMEWCIYRKLISPIALIASCSVLMGCDSARKTFGGGKNAPDEFVVYQRSPLSLPPQYGLRPPAPGKSRPQEVAPVDAAKRAVLGTSANRNIANNKSRGINVLMTQTGADKAKRDIRQLVNQESSVMAKEDQTFVNKLIFWAEDKNQPGTVVDAKKEKRRIMSNDALGKPITEGETPKVKRKTLRKGLLNF